MRLNLTTCRCFGWCNQLLATVWQHKHDESEMSTRYKLCCRTVSVPLLINILNDSFLHMLPFWVCVLTSVFQWQESVAQRDSCTDRDDLKSNTSVNVTEQYKVWCEWMCEQCVHEIRWQQGNYSMFWSLIWEHESCVCLLPVLWIFSLKVFLSFSVSETVFRPLPHINSY